jgi:mono/diheme cytochrome c family protein
MEYLPASTFVFVMLFSTLPSHAQQQSADLLPSGGARKIVADACTQCHGPGVFMQLRQGPNGWRRNVYDMALLGAQVQPSEIESVVSYLATNFGPGNELPPPMPAVSLPDGAGKSLVEQRCTLCHGLDRAAGTKRGHAEWEAIVSQMIFLGAPLSSADAKTITSYLQNTLDRQ